MAEGALMEYVAASAAREHLPFNASIEVTNRCNCSCIHCYIPESLRGGADVDQYLTVAEYDTLLSQLREAGTFCITVTGGEPLCRPEFFEIVNLVRKRGLALKIFTNGTMITSEHVKKLAALDLVEIEVSLHGADQATQDFISGTQGSFEKVLAVVRMLTAAGIRVILKTNFMRCNFNQYASLRELAQCLDAEYRFSPLVAPRNNGDTDVLVHRMSDQEYREFVDSIHTPSEIGSRPDAAHPDAVPQSDCRFCAAGIRSATVDVFGNVFACGQIRIPAGNIRRESFHSIWTNGAILRDLRDAQLSDAAACQECDLNAECHRCPGLAHLEDGDLLGPHKETCRLARIESQCMMRSLT